MIIEISIAFAALAFCCLVYYIIRTLQKSMTTLGETNHT